MSARTFLTTLDAVLNPATLLASRHDVATTFATK